MFKFYLLIGLMTLVIQDVFSQDTAAFAPIGAVWHIVDENLEVTRTEVIKDTTFAGKACRQVTSIRTNQFGEITSQGNGYTYSINDSIFYYNYSYHEFQLGYDFTAKVGDTLIFPSLYDFDVEQRYIKVVVTEVGNYEDSDLNSTTPLKYVKVENERGALIYIEKLGTTAGPFGADYHFTPISGGVSLLCYQDDNVDYRAASDYFPNCMFSSTSSIDYSTEVTIFPTLTSELINVNIKNDFVPDSYQVFSSIGQEIIFEKWTKNSFQISTNNWEKGIYFILIKSKNSFVSKRVIKY